MSGFGVTPDELVALDHVVFAAAQHARGAVSAVRAEAGEVLGGGWLGGAAAAFRSAFDEWLEGAGMVVDALDELARLAGAAGTSYAATDEGVRLAAAREMA